MSELSFNKVKEYISSVFHKEPTFSDEIIDAMTATYIFFEENYPDEVLEENIPDVKSFKIDGLNSGKRTLANIYLNRILNNVKRIYGSLSKRDKVEYLPRKKAIYIPKTTSKYWSEISSYRLKRKKFYSDEEVETVKKQVQAQIIVHELLHAAGFNGDSVGFIYPYYGQSDYEVVNFDKRAEKLGTGVFNFLEFNEFDEIITDVLAQRIVGSSETFVHRKIAEEFYTRTNAPEHGLCYGDFLGQYFITCLPDLVYAKFTKPLEYLAWFNQNNGLDLKQETFFTERIFKNVFHELRALTTPRTLPEIPRYEQGLGKIWGVQAALLKNFNRMLKGIALNCSSSEAETFLLDRINDEILLEDFALKVKGDAYKNPLDAEFENIKETLKQLAKNASFDFEELYKKQLSEYQKQQNAVYYKYENLSKQSDKAL